jgi:hypothetical protein
MLTCREIEGLLDLYIDQELDPLTRKRCAQHLRRCSQCRALLQSREQEAEVIRGGFPVPEITPGFSKRVMAKLSTSSTSRKQESRTWPTYILRKPWMTPVIAAALLVIVVYGVYSTGLFPISTKERSGAPEPYIQHDKMKDSGYPDQQDTIESQIGSKALSTPIPDFSPGYLPSGFIQEGASVSGSPAGEETEESVVYTYHNPQTGAHINLEITRNSYGTPEANKELAAGTDEVSLFAEKKGQHYLLRLTGNVSLEELKKVANSIK